MSMLCPHCHQPSKVIDSRAASDGWRRRRECLACRERWTTLEVVEQAVPQAAVDHVRALLEQFKSEMHAHIDGLKI